MLFVISRLKIEDWSKSNANPFFSKREPIHTSVHACRACMWRSNFFSEFPQLETKESRRRRNLEFSSSRNRFNAIPLNSRNNERRGSAETRRSNDLSSSFNDRMRKSSLKSCGEGKGEGMDHAWPINRTINDSFFRVETRKKNSSSIRSYGNFMEALGMKLQVA